LTHESNVDRRQTCRSCRHFGNEPGYLEDAFPGWRALGSAYGSTRAEDGICALRNIYLSADGGCDRHQDRGAPIGRDASIGP